MKKNICRFLMIGMIFPFIWINISLAIDDSTWWLINQNQEFNYQWLKYNDYNKWFELNELPWELIFSDDFSSSILSNTNYVKNNNNRSSIVNWTLETVQAVTDQPSDIHSKWFNFWDDWVTFEIDFKSMPNSDYFYWGISFYTNENWTDKWFYSLQHLYTKYYPNWYSSLKNSIITNYLSGTTWVVPVDIPWIHNAFVNHKIKFDIKNNKIIHTINGVEYSKNFDLSQLKWKDFKFSISPYGWWTGHKVVTDNIKIYSNKPLVTLPQKPTNFITSNITSTGASYAWTDTSSGTSQETKYVVKDETWKIIIDNIVPDTTSISETNLTTNTWYQRKICAVNALWETCSDIITFRTDVTVAWEKTTLFQFSWINITIAETAKYFKITFSIWQFRMNFSIENTTVI